jgi:hypothetical protein
MLYNLCPLRRQLLLPQFSTTTGYIALSVDGVYSDPVRLRCHDLP